MILIHITQEKTIYLEYLDALMFKIYPLIYYLGIYIYIYKCTYIVFKYRIANNTAFIECINYLSPMTICIEV